MMVTALPFSYQVPGSGFCSVTCPSVSAGPFTRVTVMLKPAARTSASSSRALSICAARSAFCAIGQGRSSST